MSDRPLLPIVLVAALGCRCASIVVAGEPGTPVPVDAATIHDARAETDAVPSSDRPGTCPPGMTYIPAGTFLMGDPVGDDRGALPVHRVSISPFCMDRTEVTVAAYRTCTAPGCGALTSSRFNGCTWTTVVGDQENRAINCVTWEQARSHCLLHGGDLPTEAQWEYAARGSDGRIYPWGNERPGSQLCWAGVRPTGICAVASFPSGNSPFGLFDMGGNVSEWTLDWYGPYSGDTTASVTDPAGPSRGDVHVLRGSSWLNGYSEILPGILQRASHRSYDAPPFRALENVLGFRCAHAAL